MATNNINLIDGDGIITGTAVVDYVGEGNGTASFESDANEGLDREANVTFKTTDTNPILTEIRKLVQYGLREKFTDDDFMVADGGTFHVLKT